MSEATLSALLGTVQVLVQEAIKFLWKVFIIVAVLLLISAVLPPDPFQQSIITFSGTMAQWSDLINYFIPVRFIITSAFFYTAFKYFMYAYYIFVNQFAASIGSSMANGL